VALMIERREQSNPREIERENEERILKVTKLLENETEEKRLRQE